MLDSWPISFSYRLNSSLSDLCGVLVDLDPHLIFWILDAISGKTIKRQMQYIKTAKCVSRLFEN